MTTTNEVTQDTWAGLIPAGLGTRILPFHLDNDDDLVIVEITDGTATIASMVKGVNYSVTTGANPLLSNTTEITGGDTWYIQRRQAAHQSTDLITGDKLPSGAIENALDKITLSLADLRSDDWRAVHVPDEEQPTQTTLELPDKTTRASKYLLFDGSGDITLTDGISDVGTVTFVDNGKSLVASTYSVMRTLMDVLQNVIVARGDLITSSDGTGPTVISAPDRPGSALMTSTTNEPEVGDSTSLEPTWQVPWIHPNAEVQGFSLSPDLTGVLETTHYAVRCGVTQPFYRENNAATGDRNYTHDGKDLRLDKGLGDTEQLTKNSNLAWTAGEAGGGATTTGRLGASFTNATRHVFIIGRSSDSAQDAIIDIDSKGENIIDEGSIVTWLNGDKLFIRRIGMIFSDGSGDIINFRSFGRWNSFVEPVQVMSTTALEDDNLIFTFNSGIPLCPAEECIVRLSCAWTPVAVTNLLTIRSGLTSGEGDTPSDWAKEIKASGIVAGQIQYFEIEVPISHTSQQLYAVTNNSSPSTLVVHQLGFYDPRGQAPRNTY